MSEAATGNPFMPKTLRLIEESDIANWFPIARLALAVGSHVVARDLADFEERFGRTGVRTYLSGPP